MRIDISDLSPGLHRQSQQETAGDLGLDEEKYHFTSPVSVAFTLEKVGEQIICQAVVSTSVELDCSRCLETVSADISERTTLLLALSQKSPLAGAEEEIRIVPSDADEVDVSEEIRQTVLLAIPFKPLCDESCRGLCPQCGVNLNTAQCRCRRKTADPRWAGLKELLPNGDGSSSGPADRSKKTA
jgi:uncharacterized protein